jgi:hypothetical protein
LRYVGRNLLVTNPPFPKFCAKPDAPRTLDFQPSKAAVDGLVIVRDGLIGSLSDHIRSFQLSQSSLSACLISASP